MKIGIDARFLGMTYSGIAQYSENLLSALAQLDSQNEYTVYVGSGLKRRLKVGQNFRIVPIKGAPISAKGIARMSLALRRENFDLLHVHHPLAPLMCRCPVLVTIHDTNTLGQPQNGGKRARLFDRIARLLFYPRTMKNARWIVCVSRATRDSLVEIFPDVFHKTIVVASGVEDIYRHRTADDDLERIRSVLRLPPHYILYSGAAWASKDLPGLIEAFAAVRAHDSRALQHELVLDITDDREGMDAIKEAVRKYSLQGHVRILTGLTADERHVVFESADLLLMLSKNEGFGFPAIRAQLSGVPIVAADAGALPEVIGEGGLLVDPDNAEEVKIMISRALFDDDLREFLKLKGQKNAQRFSWRDTAKTVKEIYELLF